jgi:hypothetical protein
MTWPTDRIVLGAPVYGTRPHTEHVIFHTTEGTDSSLAAGIATAKWQGTSGNTSGGSYNFILTDEGPILTVPYKEIAGSVTLNRDPAIWQPGRHPWMKEALSPEAYEDVNAYCLAISVSGHAAKLRDYAHIDRIIDDAARLVLWAERSDWARDNLVVTGHFMWQTNRSDPTQWFIDRVMERYAQITGGTTQTPADPGDDAMLVMQIDSLLPAGTQGRFVPQPAGSPYFLYQPQKDGTMARSRWNPTAERTPLLVGKFTVNGGPAMFMIGGGEHAGLLVDTKGPQPQIIAPSAETDCSAAIATALEPYQARLDEFKALAGKAL